MKISIKELLSIYITQGFDYLYEYINRIEYLYIDKYSKYILENKKNKTLLKEYLKKLIPDDKLEILRNNLL